MRQLHRTLAISSTLATLAASAWIAPGCGGAVILDNGTDSGTDATSSETGCKPGDSWTLGCNTCVCNASGRPVCTTNPCPSDGGRTDSIVSDTPASCPTVQPLGGADCVGEGLFCLYDTCPAPDDPNVHATCSSGKWIVDVFTCVSPSGCPTTAPTVSAACPTPDLKCDYPICPSGVGTESFACTSGAWVLDDTGCGASTCPTTEPAVGAACGDPAEKCDFPSSCGGLDHLACDGTKWTIASPPSCKCPPSAPTVGTACVDPVLSCPYPNKCFGTDTFACSSGKWIVSPPTCGCPPPPLEDATVGTPCSPGPATVKCPYPTKCGAFDTLFCDSGSSRWASSGPICTNPVCPSTAPTVGASCKGSASLDCPIKNSCGGVDDYRCTTSEKWSLVSSWCAGGCPRTAPKTGDSCGSSGPGTTCTFCPDDCICRSDKTWQCFSSSGCDAGSSDGGGG